MKRIAAPKFASPEHPGRIGYTKMSAPEGLSPRAVTRNNGGAGKPGAKAPPPIRPGNPKRSPIDKLGALPGKNAKSKDLLRGAGNKRVKY